VLHNPSGFNKLFLMVIKDTELAREYNLFRKMNPELLIAQK